MVTRLIGGRTHPSQITIRNTSGRPAIFRITVTPGFAQTFGGFVQEDPGTPVTTPELADQEETTVRAFFRLPGRSPAGPKAFQVRVEEIDESGRSRGLALTPQTFAGLAEILTEEIDIPLDLPGRPRGPQFDIPTAADLAFDFRDLLQAPGLVLSPGVITKPRPVRVSVVIPLSAPLPFDQPFRATLNIFLTQPEFQRRVSSTTLTVPRSGQELRQLFTVETVDLDPGEYTFRIEVFDPATNQLLQGFDVPQPFLTVLGLAVPVPPATEPPAAAAPPTPPTPAAAVPLTEEQLLLGLTLGPVEALLPPVVVASRVPPGTPVTLSLPFRFPTPTAGTSLPGAIQPLRALAFLRGPMQQITVELLDTANFVIRPGQPNRLSSITLPRNAESGPYTIQVFIVNPFDPTGPGGRSNYLPGFGPGNFPAGFTVAPLPTAPRVFDIEEEPTEPTGPSPALLQLGDLAVRSVVATPAVGAFRRGTVIFNVDVTNPTNKSGAIRVTLRPFLQPLTAEVTQPDLSASAQVLPALTTRVQIRWTVPSDAPFGSYGAALGIQSADSAPTRTLASASFGMVTSVVGSPGDE